MEEAEEAGGVELSLAALPRGLGSAETQGLGSGEAVHLGWPVGAREASLWLPGACTSMEKQVDVSVVIFEEGRRG